MAGRDWRNEDHFSREDWRRPGSRSEGLHDDRYGRSRDYGRSDATMAKIMDAAVKKGV